MDAWQVTATGEPHDVLARVDIEPPVPGPGMVRLRVDAAAVGFPDVLMCAGTYLFTPARPFTPGQEVVGVVDAVGEGVDDALTGTRQMGVTAFYLGAGGLAEQCLAAANTIFPAPPDLDDETAAGFHIPFVTAWNALVDRAAIQPGENLVVLGAAGGSGSAAVLLGKSLGARVVAVAGGVDKASFCAGLGADEVIDHHTIDDLATTIREVTDGSGAAVVFDPVGGETGERMAKAMANHGRLLLVGFASGRWPVIDPARMVTGNFSTMGVYAGAYDRPHVEAIYDRLLDRRRDGSLGSIPVRPHSFDAVPEALSSLAGRSATGKAIIHVGGT
ncbi:MAG: NADPH:quinone oxidoreductase family protein [Acidimicrobiales bacterium]|nr:NADPH:quinone oxidoreductase family protein [Acidimicrobiales bacterium]